MAAGTGLDSGSDSVFVKSLTVSTLLDEVKSFVGNQRFVVIAHWNNCYHCTEFLKNNGLFQRLIDETDIKFIKVELDVIQHFEKGNIPLYRYLKLNEVRHYPYIYALDPKDSTFIDTFDKGSRMYDEMKKWVSQHLSLRKNVLSITATTSLHQIKSFVGSKHFVVIAHWNKCGHCVEFLEKSGLFQRLLGETTAKFIKVELNVINQLKGSNKEVYEYLKLAKVVHYPFIYMLNPVDSDFLEVFKNNYSEYDLMKNWMDRIHSSTSGGRRKSKVVKKGKKVMVRKFSKRNSKKIKIY
jgi:hypothetical protein